MTTRFVTKRCIATTPFPGSVMGFNGEDMTQGAVDPPPRKDATTEYPLTAKDYIMPPYSPVFSVRPQIHELSVRRRSTLEGDVPSIFSNFYDRSFDVDTTAIQFVGVSPDGIVDPEVAMEDPLAGARTAILLHGSTTMAVNGLFFKDAHLGHYVEYLPVDSGWRPDNHESYSPALFRPVLAEEIEHSAFYDETVLPGEAINIAYQAFADGGAKLDQRDSAAVVKTLWSIAKVKSLPVKLNSTFRNDIDNDWTALFAMLKNTPALTQVNKLLENLETPATNNINKGIRLSWFILETKDDDILYLGSPKRKSLATHFLGLFDKDPRKTLIPETDDVYLRFMGAKTDTDDLIAGTSIKKADLDDTSFEVVNIQPGFDFTQAKIVVNSNPGGIKQQFQDILALVKSKTNYTVGANVKKIETLLTKYAAPAQPEDHIKQAFGSDWTTLPADAQAVLQKAVDQLHAYSTVGRTLDTLMDIYPEIDSGEYYFFFDHPLVLEVIQDSIKFDFNAAKSIGVEYGTGTGITPDVTTVSLEAAMGGYSKEVPKYSLGTTIPMTFTHPVVQDVLSRKTSSRKRKTFSDASVMPPSSTTDNLSDVLADIKTIKPSWHRICGEFIGMEGENGIRILLRKPCVT